MQNFYRFSLPAAGALGNASGERSSSCPSAGAGPRHRHEHADCRLAGAGVDRQVLPLYRQERIFERAGFGIPRSTLAQLVGPCGGALQPVVDALKAEMLTRVT